MKKLLDLLNEISADLVPKFEIIHSPKSATVMYHSFSF